MNENALVNTLPDGSLERIEAQINISEGIFYLCVNVTLIKNGQAYVQQGWNLELDKPLQRRLLEAVHYGIRQE